MRPTAHILAIFLGGLAGCTTRPPPPAPQVAAGSQSPAPGISARAPAPPPAPPPGPPSPAAPRPGDELARRGDEIVVCGRLFHTGAPVILWTDPGGYDAYRVERRFARPGESSWEHSRGSLDTPNRYGARPVPPALAAALNEDDLDRLRAGGWSLPELRQAVDQFVIHYDNAGTSRACFRILHDVRGLSVHFMLDLDGTIYQTLDLKERAWHATTANDRAVGIEIAGIGAFPDGAPSPLDQWYAAGDDGRTRLTLPPRLGDGGLRTPGFQPRPARDEPITGDIHGRAYRQYDFTPEQYESLTKLTAALCAILPNLRCDYPRDESGALITRALTPAELAAHRGLLGHFHIQDNKLDPGPAFQWDLVVEGARDLIGRDPAQAP